MAEIKGIDVSSFQGKPDWTKVSNSGVKFAILRIHQKSGIDTSFEHNYKGCKSNGILIGGYKYSQLYLQQQQQKERSEGYEKKNVFYRSDGTGWNIFHDCIIALVDDENGCT